ncbi:PIG-L family deacetylase [Bacillus sp. JJ1521]|uniref:PIG-L deacetylase family protein n=1 Tax=Bacillus sp. JJ1521 TaxID=3122957 RepID=UPI002FFFDB34
MLQFMKKKVNTLILILIHYIQGNEKLIKMIEYTRGLYRYPNKMLGRNLQTVLNHHTDVLVFAAHPDDDILGVGTTLYRHSLKNEEIRVVFITNGTGRGGESWHISANESKKKSEIRYREAIRALSLINIPEENILSLGYPDGGTQRYLKKVSADILRLIQKFNPERIYVHCIEGGHRDHDLTSFVVKSLCNKIGFTNVFEWTEYNPIQPLGTQDVKFLPTHPTRLKEITIEISEEERSLKRKMLASHQSQDVEQFFLQGEAIRPANTSQIELELYKHCQIPMRTLHPLVNDFNKSLTILQKKPNAQIKIV